MAHWSEGAESRIFLATGDSRLWALDAATGVPVVDTMGVRGGAIHSPDEFMIVPSLRERAALSALVLAKLSTGDHL